MTWIFASSEAPSKERKAANPAGGETFFCSPGSRDTVTGKRVFTSLYTFAVTGFGSRFASVNTVSALNGTRYAASWMGSGMRPRSRRTGRGGSTSVVFTIGSSPDWMARGTPGVVEPGIVNAARRAAHARACRRRVLNIIISFPFASCARPHGSLRQRGCARPPDPCRATPPLAHGVNAGHGEPGRGAILRGRRVRTLSKGPTGGSAKVSPGGGSATPEPQLNEPRRRRGGPCRRRAEGR